MHSSVLSIKQAAVQLPPFPPQVRALSRHPYDMVQTSVSQTCILLSGNQSSREIADVGVSRQNNVLSAFSVYLSPTPLSLPDRVTL